MKRISLLLVISFVLVAYSFTQAGEPKIDFSERFWDFGRVPQQSTVTHIFWIKNVGSDTLKEIAVKTPWGCTKAPLKKTELAIGDSTELEISYYTGLAKTVENKYVQVSSNDTASGYNRLEIIADVKAKPDTMLMLTYSPYSLEFIEEKGGKLKEKKIEFINIGEEEYKLQIIDYPRGFFEAELKGEILKPGKKIELKVKPAKKLPPDTLKNSITLNVVGEKEFRITIPLTKEKPSGLTLPPVKGK